MNTQTLPAIIADPDLLCSTTIRTEPASPRQLTVVDPEPEWRPTPPTPFELAWYEARDRAEEWRKIEGRSLDALYRALAEAFVMYRIATTDAEALARLNHLLTSPELIIKVGRPAGDDVAAKVIGLIFGWFGGQQYGQRFHQKAEVLRQAQFRHSRWAQVLVSLSRSGAVTASDARHLLRDHGIEALRLAHATGIQEDPAEDEADADLELPEDLGEPAPTEANPSEADAEWEPQAEANAEPAKPAPKRTKSEPKAKPAEDGHRKWVYRPGGTEKEIQKWQDALAGSLAEVMPHAGGWSTAMDGANLHPEVPWLASIYRGQAFLLDPVEPEHAKLIDLIRKLDPPH